jgi:catechol 2,3-dioxygenase-like lactoylglutathione lyase family enzyme
MTTSPRRARVQALLLAVLAASACRGARPNEPANEPAWLGSVATLVHDTDAMVAFDREVFGFVFEEVETSGVTSWFGTAPGSTLELVPLHRDGRLHGAVRDPDGNTIELYQEVR